MGTVGCWDPPHARAGRGARPSPVALITFVLVLREGETLGGPYGRWGWGAGEGSGRDCLEMGEGAPGTGTRETGKGGLSASAQKRINSTRSNGLTAKRAHRGAAPRGAGKGWAKDGRKGAGRRGSERTGDGGRA